MRFEIAPEDGGEAVCVPLGFVVLHRPTLSTDRSAAEIGLTLRRENEDLTSLTYVKGMTLSQAEAKVRARERGRAAGDGRGARSVGGGVMLQVPTGGTRRRSRSREAERAAAPADWAEAEGADAEEEEDEDLVFERNLEAQRRKEELIAKYVLGNTSKDAGGRPVSDVERADRLKLG